MKCPFLQDARVKYCQASIYRKLIVERGSGAHDERCSSPSWVECPAAPQSARELSQRAHCPFLREANAEYCGAASLIKYIPASDALLSRCKSDGHLYCELYLAHADPGGTRLPACNAAECERTPHADGIPVPANLFYAPNHLWLDVAEDGYCHVGIDGFLANVAGDIEKISFIASRSVDRPIAVVTVDGVDLQLVFPNPLQLLGSNLYLRTTPSKLTSDPYGAGWLFEGLDPSARLGSSNGSVCEGLRTGDEALAWMHAESERLAQFVHACAARPAADGAVLMADGGSFERGIAKRLEREDRIQLFNEFFAPREGWRRSW